MKVAVFGKTNIWKTDISWYVLFWFLLPQHMQEMGVNPRQKHHTSVLDNIIHMHCNYLPDNHSLTWTNNSPTEIPRRRSMMKTTPVKSKKINCRFIKKENSSICFPSCTYLELILNRDCQWMNYDRQMEYIVLYSTYRTYGHTYEQKKRNIEVRKPWATETK